MNATPEPLLIVGASVRAAAQGARRAGFAPYGVDLFGDADLGECCSAATVAEYPDGLLEAARSAPPGDWLYTGGLENYPDLVDTISAGRRLLGNDGSTLRKVRDPWQVAAALARHGLPAPELARTAEGLSTDGGWLRKPLRSSGGQGIYRWRGKCADEEVGNRGFFQRFIAGVSCSAVFVGNRRQAALCGITQQLIGTKWTGAKPFSYSGSIGPLAVSRPLQQQFQRLGNALAGELALAGLFGVDAILYDDTVWPVEINPRYTASIEVLERSLRRPMMSWHAAACQLGELPEIEQREPLHAATCCGKAVLYARQTQAVDERLAAALLAFRGDAIQPRLADIPRAGTTLHCGWPVATVLAEGKTIDEVAASLRSGCDELRTLLQDG